MKTCTVCKETKEITDYYKYAANKDGISYRCKECDDKARQQWSEKNPERAKESQRKRNLKHKYGLTIEDYDRILEDQGNSCAICHKKDYEVSGDRFSKIKFAVDHNHTTGKVRGILCNQCNRALGMFSDSEEVLRSALKYLETH